MKTPSGEDSENQARQQLSRACRALDRSARMRWVLLTCQIVLAGGLGLALLDYWFVLPVLWRVLGASVLAGLLLYGLFRLVRFLLRPTRLKQGALAIEESKPELGCEISTAAEYLSGERKIQHEYEPELAAALQAKTARVLSQSAPSGAGWMGLAVLLALTLLALLVLALFAPGGFTALERTAVPFVQAHYTSLQVKPGDFEVAIGHNAEITNVFSGRLPKDARLSWAQAASEQWQTAALRQGTQGVYLGTLTNLQADVVYRVAGGDALSPQYRITTYLPPAVKAFNTRLDFPAYTQLAPAVQHSADITAVRATQAQIQIQPTVELKQAQLRFSNGPGLALTPGPDGSWGGTVPITKDTDYWIELADTKGHSGVNEKPYHIKAVPDNPPRVEITDPGKDIRSSATNKVMVKISVADDFGVEKIRLVYNKLGGPQQTIEARRDSEHKGEVLASAELDLSSLGLKEYELVAYHAEATDNNTLDGPGIGKSPVYFIEITDQQAGPSLSQTQGQKVNLLEVQKQIVADTTALAGNAAAEKFKEMALRQRDAADFGRLYQDAISGGGPEAAVQEMHSALTDMELAGNQLENQHRADAIPREESALAHLYQVVKLMPELQNLPTTTPPTNQPPPSPKLQVVLQAIQERKKENPDNPEVEKALKQAQDLARAQAQLNSAMRQPGPSGAGSQPSEQPQQAAQQPGSQDPNQAKQQQAQGAGKARGEPTGQKETADNSQDSASPGQMAAKEDQLSKEAAALAEQLQRLAGKDQRVGHNPGNNAARAAAKMAAASQAMAQGRNAAAGEHGFQGELAMRNVVDQLDRLVKNRPEPTDIAHEDAPKGFETLISEYLKRLSHAE